MRGNQLTGEQQSPGGGINKHGFALAEVRIPVTVADFIADQHIAGGFIRNTQQCFRQAHQRDPLLGGEGEFLKQSLYQPGASAAVFLITQLFCQTVSQFMRGLCGIRGELRLRQQHSDCFRLRNAVCGCDSCAGHGLRQDITGKLQKRLAADRRLSRCGVIFLCGRCSCSRQCAVRQRIELSQVIKNSLSDQPVRRAVNFLRCGFDPLTGFIIQSDAHCGTHHVHSS